jgi:NADH-quinone oxidoreductase subunit E
VDTVNCLGACALAPLVVVDDQYHGKMTQQNIKKLLKKYAKKEGTQKGD